MPNIKTVGVTSGVPTSGSGTVSTLDNLIGTAGTESSNVLTVQGSASGTAVPVSLASVPSHAVTNAGTFAVQAATNADGTAGSAVPSKGLLVQGSDGTNARNISTTTGGVVKVDLSSTAANTTAVKVDASSVAVPITDNSGSITVDNGGTFAVQQTSQGYSASVSITRPNDTSAYAANDVIGTATGSTAGQTFSSMGPSAGRIMLTSASLEIDDSAVISGETSYRLYLYNVTPPSATGDNGAWDLPSGDRSSFLGYIDLGTPVDLGSTLYVESNFINKQVLLAGTSLFGYLVTNGAYTPTANRVYKITLHAVSV